MSVIPVHSYKTLFPVLSILDIILCNLKVVNNCLLPCFYSPLTFIRINSTENVLMKIMDGSQSQHPCSSYITWPSGVFGSFYSSFLKLSTFSFVATNHWFPSTTVVVPPQSLLLAFFWGPQGTSSPLLLNLHNFLHFTSPVVWNTCSLLLNTSPFVRVLQLQSHLFSC